MRKGVDCNGKEWEEKEISKLMKDISGKQFNKLTALFPVKSDSNDHSYWLCLCECGNLLVCRTDQLHNNRTKSCGCWKVERRRLEKERTRQKMIGSRFGKLTVIALDHTIVYSPDVKKDCYLCQCDCGSTCVIVEDSLVSGATQSCGCITSRGEYLIKQILDNSCVKYVHNKGYFKDLIGDNGGLLRYDFILFSHDDKPVRLIEYDGKQHFEPIDFFGGEERLLQQQQNDALKNQYALSHNIPLVRIPYKKRDNMTLEDLLGDQFLIKGE